MQTSYTENIMKTRAFAALLLVSLSACASTPPADSANAEKTSTTENETKPDAGAADIVDTAIAAGSFKTLVAAVQAAGLVETLKGEGPFTVFAPTDEAFAKLPKGAVDDLLKPENKEKLKAVLTYHVVSGKVMAADVAGMNGKSAKTVQGGELKIKVDGSNVSVDNAKVVKTDIECKNGVIHVIDTVVMPPM
jgi:transforming growth factor-beta-induced protein